MSNFNLFLRSIAEQTYLKLNPWRTSIQSLFKITQACVYWHFGACFGCRCKHWDLQVINDVTGTCCVLPSIEWTVLTDCKTRTLFYCTMIISRDYSSYALRITNRSLKFMNERCTCCILIGYDIVHYIWLHDVIIKVYFLTLK